jgi:hypothetical protein
MREIKLTQGEVALIDDIDFELVSGYKWHCYKGAYTKYAISGCRKNKVYMHRLVAGATDPKTDVDHKNSDGLCNLRSNLRIITHQQNTFNKRLSKSNTSGFKGVCFDKEKGKWKSKIKLNGVDIHIGYFKDKEDAAKAYDLKAKELFGEFARTNF